MEKKEIIFNKNFKLNYLYSIHNDNNFNQSVIIHSIELTYKNSSLFGITDDVFLMGDFNPKDLIENDIFSFLYNQDVLNHHELVLFIYYFLTRIYEVNKSIDQNLIPEFLMFILYYYNLKFLNCFDNDNIIYQLPIPNRKTLLHQSNNMHMLELKKQLNAKIVCLYKLIKSHFDVKHLYDKILVQHTNIVNIYYNINNFFDLINKNEYCVFIMNSFMYGYILQQQIDIKIEKELSSLLLFEQYYQQPFSFDLLLFNNSQEINNIFVDVSLHFLFEKLKTIYFDLLPHVEKFFMIQNDDMFVYDKSYFNGFINIIKQLYKLNKLLISKNMLSESEIFDQEIFFKKLLCSNCHPAINYLFQPDILSNHSIMNVLSEIQKIGIIEYQFEHLVSIKQENFYKFIQSYIPDFNPSIDNELNILIDVNRFEQKNLGDFIITLIFLIRSVYIQRILTAFNHCRMYYNDIDKWYKTIYRTNRFSDRNYKSQIKNVFNLSSSVKIAELCNTLKNDTIHFAFENAVYMYWYFCDLCFDVLNNNHVMDDFLKIMHITEMKYYNTSSNKIIFENSKKKVLDAIKI